MERTGADDEDEAGGGAAVEVEDDDGTVGALVVVGPEGVRGMEAEPGVGG